MVIYRLTENLFKKLKVPLQADPVASTGTLGDWYCNKIILNRQHFLLCVSSQTLLPVLVSGKAPLTFPSRLQEKLGEILLHLNIPTARIENELAQMNDWVFAKTASRSVVGAMNDYIRISKVMVESGLNIDDLSWRLLDIPFRPLGMKSSLYATAKAFGIEVHRKPLLSKVHPPLKLMKSDD
ncbi:MAG: hypothetical protein EOP10_04170 [Proteobacteria bacterium]|nr:MAG: hypothetical protein EOP10_04170 [Pseudomonadota bacterium]